MLDTFDQQKMDRLQADDISDSLERGSIVYFPQSPVALPSEEDLGFLREELPRLLKLKNISYHPEAGKVRGLDDSDPDIDSDTEMFLLSKYRTSEGRGSVWH